MTRIFTGLVAAAAIAVFGAPVQAASLSTNLSDPLVVLDPGGTIQIQIIVDTDAVFFAETQLNFDSGVIGTTALVNNGAPNGGICAGAACSLNVGSGSGFQRMGIADISGALGLPPQPINGGNSPFVLGVLTVTAVGDGVTQVVIDPIFGQDNNWENAGQALFTVQVGVPEPATLVLLGLGLAALAGLRSREA